MGEKLMEKNKVKSQHDEGFSCFHAGQSIRSNPHEEGTPQHIEWKHGFLAASKESSYAAADAAGKF
ncbi:hypothetical protein fHeYen801_063 [Yersinia phage fHe-Yen8-01]|nr:hypothetical protein fHeYen801_063 [Yersinia phage fHe-Yen8-01]